MPKKSTTTKDKKKTAKPKAKAKKTVARKKVVLKKNADVEAKKEAKKKMEYLYSVGKRKTSIAQVRVYKKGSGKININKKDYTKYFPTFEYQEIVVAPLKIIGQLEKLDVSVKVMGGGVVGQAEAARNGIAKALIQLNPNFRKPLKKAGYLKRDARKKERKKPGLKRARRAPQWKKR